MTPWVVCLPAAFYWERALRDLNGVETIDGMGKTGTWEDFFDLSLLYFFVASASALALAFFLCRFSRSINSHNPPLVCWHLVPARASLLFTP